MFAAARRCRRDRRARSARSLGAELHNLYGPTEAAVDVTVPRASTGDRDRRAVPIGAPVWNTAGVRARPRLRPVPVGVPGELYLAGVQLARGYLGRAGPDRGAVRRRTRSARRASGCTAPATWCAGAPDGELEYLGRTDFQVKLRGLRIELGEIEAALLADAGGGAGRRAWCTTTRTPASSLVGYVVPRAGVAARSTADAAQRRVGARCPRYMVPAASWCSTRSR